MIASITSSCPMQGMQHRISRFTQAFSDYIGNCCINLQNSEILKLLCGAVPRIFKEF